MSPLNLISDGYEGKARLYPALALLAPGVATIIVTMGAKLSAVQSLAAVVAGFGGAFLLSQLARDAGKKGESQPANLACRNSDPGAELRLDRLRVKRWQISRSSRASCL